MLDLNPNHDNLLNLMQKDNKTCIQLMTQFYGFLDLVVIKVNLVLTPTQIH